MAGRAEPVVMVLSLVRSLVSLAGGESREKRRNQTNRNENEMCSDKKLCCTFIRFAQAHLYILG